MDIAHTRTTTSSRQLVKMVKLHVSAQNEVHEADQTLPSTTDVPEKDATVGANRHNCFLVRTESDFGYLSAVTLARCNQSPIVVVPNIYILISTSTHKVCAF